MVIIDKTIILSREERIRHYKLIFDQILRIGLARRSGEMANGPVAKLASAADLKSADSLNHEGSIPSGATINDLTRNPNQTLDGKTRAGVGINFNELKLNEENS